MITRRVTVQVVVFVVIALVGIGYVGVRYIGLGSLVGRSGYTVKMQLADSGGIFTRAEVTYRGVTVGKVGALHLIPGGVEADLAIDPGTPHIPASTKAVVADRSAVGEQYVDLRPDTTAGPYLTDGSVIPMSHTATPIPVQQLLSDVNGLVASVPLPQLRTVVNELGTAFAGTGGELQRLLDSASALTDMASANLPQTLALLHDGRTVLATQNQQASDIESFSRDLHIFAQQLAADDPSLRRLVEQAPLAGDQLSGLFHDFGPDLGTLIANLLTVSDVAITRTTGIEQLLVTYPAVTGAALAVLPGDGFAHFGLVVNLFNPPPCTAGYQGTEIRPGTDTSPAPLNTEAHCAAARGNPTDVRGAQNAPYRGVAGAAPPGAPPRVPDSQQPPPAFPVGGSR